MNTSIKLASNDDLVVSRPLIMAILNATPDSFSDGGELEKKDRLEERIQQVITKKADIIDVGGESTRPGFKPIDEQTEIKRVVPVIKAIRKQSMTIPISIDTQKAVVAEAAINAGADFINDVSALSDPKMAEVCMRANCSIVLMRNKALTQDLIPSCRIQFEQIVKSAIQKGLSKDQIILDPGLGFGQLDNQDFSVLPGSHVDSNLNLIKSINHYSLGFPVLIGASRKRFVGKIMNEANPKKRISGSVKLAVLAALSGATILRVHDVEETISALEQSGLQVSKSR